MRKLIYESTPKTQEWYVGLDPLLTFYTLWVKRVIPTNDSSVTRSSPARENPARLKPILRTAAVFLGADLDVRAQVVTLSNSPPGWRISQR